MSKVKLYVEKVNRYYKLKLKKDSKLNSVGVLYHDGYGSKLTGVLEPKDDWVEHFRTVIPEKDWVAYTGADNSIAYHWQVFNTVERSLEILNELFDVEMIAPKERINQTIKLPVDVINQLKQIVKSPEEYKGEVKEYPVSDHILQWIKKVK